MKLRFLFRNGLVRALWAAALAFAVRLLTQSFGFVGLFPFETTYVTVCIFVQAMVLSGVLQDYKEAERLPSAIAMALESILTQLMVAFAHKPTLSADTEDRRRIVEHLLHIVDAHLLAIIQAEQSSSLPGYLASVSSHLLPLIAVLRQHDLHREAGDIQGELGKVRAGIARIVTIAQTQFMPSAYRLYDSLVVIVLVCVQVASYNHWLAALVYSTLLTFLFTYMSLLIRDADNPVEYAQYKDVDTFVTAHGGLLLDTGKSITGNKTPVSSVYRGDEVSLDCMLVVRNRVVLELMDCHPAVRSSPTNAGSVSSFRSSARSLPPAVPLFISSNQRVVADGGSMINSPEAVAEEEMMENVMAAVRTTLIQVAAARRASVVRRNSKEQGHYSPTDGAMGMDQVTGGAMMGMM